MVNVMDMKDLRYLNLFSNITHVQTRFCFTYNDTIFFCVPKPLVSKAIGAGGRNVKKMSLTLKRKIKVIPIPSLENVELFIQQVVAPVSFREIDVKDDEIILTAGSQHKAALIGRNKRRLLEMQKIVEGFFRKEFRIV